ncbi:kell blood group glycoprotein isoform X2 [Nelusetta ayraudi]|uniref:kell blood group glycoprotein isoform X2 n=1 Tax=Nelusetta ayraudi TaxID=303726 RepID=UPI003F705F8A
MRETVRELELSVQPSPQPEPEGRLRPPPLLQLAVSTQDPPVADQQLQTDLLPLELQQRAKPLSIKYRLLLGVLLGFSVCAAIVALIYFVHFQGRSHHADGGAPCLSPACQWASTHLSRSADPFQHPCDYFLSTCTLNKVGRQSGQDAAAHSGNQREEVTTPQERAQSRQTHKGLGEEMIPDRKSLLLLHLRDILESNDSPGRTSLQKARRFYQSCLDTEAIEKAREEPFLQLVQTLGGWPVTQNRTDFNSTLGLLMREYATFPFFSLRVGPKEPGETANGENKIYIQIDQPDLLIPVQWNSHAEKSQSNNQAIRPFLATWERYLTLLGFQPMTWIVPVGMFTSLSSELAVATAPLPYRLSKGLLYQNMTIRELQSQAPAIDWLGCLQATFHPHPVTQDDLVLLHNLPYILQMSGIISKWATTHEMSSSNPLHWYMVLHLLHTLVPALDSRFSETAKNLSVALGSTEGVSPRWKRCVLDTESGFEQVLKNLLSEKMAHREATEMMRNVFSSFKAKLQEQRWTNKSVQMVIERVESLSPRLWTAKDTSGEAELDLIFSKVGTQSFFSNYIQLLSSRQKRRVKLLSERTEAADVAFNYGVIGFLMAKDILHMILPDIHSQSEAVRAVAECIWAHYLTVTGKKGELSLSATQQQEVWVQYSALQIALRAYQQSLKKYPSDASILGLSHTRLFLTSFSQVNCDSDKYSEFMPLEPSFLITVLCAKSDLCPASLQCLKNTQQYSVTTC